jgi:hypothetical protein
MLHQIPVINVIRTNLLFKELLTSNKVNRCRGEDNLNQSLVYMQLQQNDRAIDALKQGIEVAPY